jgi:vancomycin resistance protein YoaR
MSSTAYTLYGPRRRRLRPLLAGALAVLLLAAGGAAVLVRATDSGPTEAETRRALEARAQRLLDRPIRVVGAGRELELTGRMLGARPLVGPRAPLVFALDPARVAQLARELDARVATPAVDAELVVEGDRVRVAPGRPGRGLDREALARELRTLPATLVLPVRTTPPRVTTAELAGLGIRERVSGFTTEYAPGEPRVVNIRRAAELLDGTIVPAGGTFSLNSALGERTTERGFVPAPQISGGRLTDSVGGGISQVATTLYNAAFFAGLELVEHQPHSFYIDRYPAGREATISWGGPELVFRNDWPAALLVKVEATETSVTVRFFSSAAGRRVESTTGEPYAYVEPVVRTVVNPTLAPGTRTVVQDAGGPGFTIDYTRRVYDGERLRRDETFRWRYDARDAIVEVGPTARSGV